MKRPAFQFYPADWRKDVALRSCSVAARGLWIDLMCLAHECDPYGYLMVNGRAMTPAQIAGQIGLTSAECKRLLKELTDNGVARLNDDGVVYSKRMVDDERVRNARAEGGKGGAEHGQKGAEHGSKGGRPAATRGDKEPPSDGGKEPPSKPPSKPPLHPPKEPPPSSSSSSSASAEDSVADATAAAAAKPLSAKERLWALGVPLLGESSRSYIAKLAKTYDEELVATVMAEATLERPIEPKAWVTAACEARAKARPSTKTNGHEPVDLLADPTPDWAINAGFPDRFQAENAGCTKHTAAKFRNGRRLDA